MSIAGLIDSEKPYKESFHRRNVSGELDVFEAARYFSGYNEAGAGYNNSTSFTQKMTRDEIHGHRGRISLDMPMRNLLPQQFHGVVEKQMKEKKHNKQPSSPGGRLASFLNSLFSQSASRKKKSKSMKDHEDESPGGGRRRRRTSISHFRSSSNITDSKSNSNICSSSLRSGFRTPPYIETPTKSCKEFRNFSDQKRAVSLSNYTNGQGKPTSLLNEFLEYDKNKREINTLADNKRYSNSFSEKNRNCVNEISEREREWREKYSQEEREKFSELRKFSAEVEIDDGAESDSSSDLFELQINYDLGDYYSSGLPVYETTNMDNIKRAPISNGNL